MHRFLPNLDYALRFVDWLLKTYLSDFIMKINERLLTWKHLFYRTIFNLLLIRDEQYCLVQCVTNCTIDSLCIKQITLILWMYWLYRITLLLLHFYCKYVQYQTIGGCFKVFSDTIKIFSFKSSYIWTCRVFLNVFLKKFWLNRLI